MLLWSISPLLFSTNSSCLSGGDALFLSEDSKDRVFPAESRAVFSGTVASYKNEMSLKIKHFHFVLKLINFNSLKIA